MTKKLLNLSLLLMVFSSLHVSAQQPLEILDKDWHLKDKNNSGFYGISVDKAYDQLLKGKTPKNKVIVAIIDSGVDTTHEDLKSVFWKNRKEIPGNGIDDDKNGYIDDTMGWNFIGGKDGKNVSKDSDEASRVYYRYKKIFGDSVINESTLDQEKRSAFKAYSKAKNQMESQAKEAAMYVLILKDIVAKIPEADSVLRIAMDKKSFTGDELLEFKTTDPVVAKAKSLFLGLFQQTRQMTSSNTKLTGELLQFYGGQKSKLDALEKEPPAYRSDIVKDNYDNPQDRFYGNNDIMGPDPSHGTHVAGIVAADRKNNTGVMGVADHVEIMNIRAVPDGDEHDKDIANAILYAAENGAKIINMSFGKSFSPEKKWVDAAVKLAETKGILLVHAAGNDAKNIDTEDNFPSKNFNNDTSQYCKTWINVGASGPSETELIAGFSNFGKREVHVFAPGYRIYSTLPGGNAYGEQNGTSMASPVVAGLAALILSYYPELSAVEVKQIIEKTAVKIDDKIANRPGSEDEKVSLSEISSSGGIVNAFEAIKMAELMVSEKKVLNPGGKTTKKPVKK